MLAKTVERDQHDWDSQLPKDLFAYKTAIHESTSFSPFHLNFGRSPQLPIDLMLSRVQASTICSYPQFVQAAHQQRLLSPLSPNTYNCNILARSRYTIIKALQKSSKLVIEFGYTILPYQRETQRNSHQCGKAHTQSLINLALSTTKFS